MYQPSGSSVGGCFCYPKYCARSKMGLGSIVRVSLSRIVGFHFSSSQLNRKKQAKLSSSSQQSKIKQSKHGI
jgi:hypothetical protein